MKKISSTIDIDISIIDAAYDYRFLLSRGYNQKHALDMVTLKYSLNHVERLLLYRCVHSMQYIVNVIQKITCSSETQNILIIDFYNVLLTVLCMLEREHCNVYLCDDCILRDLRGSKLKPQDHIYLPKAYELILDAISLLRPLKIIVIADKNVSHSAIQIEQFNKHIIGKGFVSHNILSSTPDRDSIEISKREKAIVASSDSVVIENSYKVFPLTTIILNKLNIHSVINFAELLGSPCNNCYEYTM